MPAAASRLAKLALAAGFALLFSVVAAFAHASLTSAEPRDGSIVTAAPRQVRLTFNEPVAPFSLKLLRPDGQTIELADFTLRDRTLEIVTPRDLGEGTYALSWRVVSEDGHPIGGTVMFSVGRRSASAEATVAPADRLVRAGLLLLKITLYAGLFLGVGGAFATIVLMPGLRACRRPLAMFIAAGGLGALLSLGFQGLDALGEPLGRIAGSNVWAAGWSTSYGGTVVAALIGFVLAGAAISGRGRIAKLEATAGLAATGIALALSGHASAAEPQWLMRPAVGAHAVTVAIWIGSLLPLGAALRRRDAAAVPSLAAFSRIIPAIIAVLVIAGAVLAVVQVERPSALLETPYGRILLVKLCLVGLLFLIAAVNRWRLTKPASEGDMRASARLARLIAIETAVAIAVFGTTAAWRFTPPPRSLAAESLQIQAVEPASTHVHSDKGMAMIDVTPGNAGPVRIEASLFSGDSQPLHAKSVSVVLSNPGAHVEPFKSPMTQMENGDWQASDVMLPIGGTWTVRLDILVNDFEIIRLAGEIEIKH